ncbi:MAG: lysophospholipid acyltransferase family protein [Burkholderiaceae bacterium]
MLISVPRALLRLLSLIGLLFIGLAITFTVFPFVSRSEHERWIERWSGWLLAAAGMRLNLVGHIPDDPRGLLLVANHLSWIDIFVFNRVRAARFVAKSEIARWPVIGLLVARVGTLFIERGRRHAVQHMLHTMAAHLERGELVAVFPEGTTSDGRSLLPFHANLIQAAIVTATPVLPVALSFFDHLGRPSDAPLFVGDTNLVQSVWRIISAPRLEARVQLLEPIPTHHDMRRVEVASIARQRIGEALGLAPETPAH